MDSAALKDVYQAKVQKVMGEFKRHKLKSHKKSVVNRKQAIAIALSEASRKVGK